MSSVVVFGLGGGHLQRLLPLIAGLARRGLTVHVLTRAAARAEVEAVGGVFFDVFARYPVEAVDRESIPMPSRQVTFAAAYLEPLAADIAALRPALVVYDSFFVVAPLIARRLGVPYVGMRAGHAQIPARAVAEIRADPRVATSPACLAAAARLRDEHGLAGASPFSYLDGLSPHLNLYPQPAPYLRDDERRAFEPIAFYGTLAPDLRAAASGDGPLGHATRRPRVYVAFGAVIWMYYAEAARAALAALTATLAGMGAEVLVGLGRHAVPDGLARPGVRVETWVDQWAALADADLFVTHHGLGSTHEAVFHQVPMLSYPFFGDQPALARRCQELGLAVALAEAPRVALEPATIEAAVRSALARRAELAARLAEARGWELEVIAGRETVLDRLLALR